LARWRANRIGHRVVLSRLNAFILSLYRRHSLAALVLAVICERWQFGLPAAATPLAGQTPFTEHWLHRLLLATTRVAPLVAPTGKLALAHRGILYHFCTPAVFLPRTAVSRPAQSEPLVSFRRNAAQTAPTSTWADGASLGEIKRGGGSTPSLPATQGGGKIVPMQLAWS
jgi:hypothetical protein